MYGSIDLTYQYPPELFDLLVDAIPRLNKSKKGVLIFFRGAGVLESTYSDISAIVNSDPSKIKKYEIARTILKRLNEKGEPGLRERREVLKRVVEFEDFTACWPDDRQEAIGYVAQIRQIVNIKDSFTKIEQERKAERQKHMAEKNKEIQKIREKKEKLQATKNDLFTLFSEKDSHKRGIALETVLNRLFEVYEISVRESFVLRDKETGTAMEQIDGLVELDGSLYLVEMKWWNQSIGKGEVSNHLVNVFSRGHSRGIFISATDFTAAAISVCKEALHKTVVILCTLHEITALLEKEGDLREFFRKKIQAAIADKNPFFPIY